MVHFHFQGGFPAVCEVEICGKSAMMVMMMLMLDDAACLRKEVRRAIIGYLAAGDEPSSAALKPHLTYYTT